MRELRALRALALALVALLLGALPAAAQTLRSEDGSVRAELTYTWPSWVQRGYVPVLAELTNTVGEPRDVAVEVVVRPYWNVDHTLRRDLRLDPGETREVELLIPAGGPGHTTGPEVTFSLEVNGGRRFESLSDRDSTWADGSCGLLLVTPQRLPKSELEALSEALLDRTSLGNGNPDQRVHVGLARPDQLPVGWEAYTSLDALCLDLGAEQPSEEVLAAIAAWVRSGGQLMVVGEGAGARLAGTDAFAGTLEERFRLANQGNTFLLGLGHVTVADGAPSWEAGRDEVRDLAQRLETGRSGGSRPSWVPDMRGWAGGGGMARIPGVGELPLQGFMALLLLFAVIIGPVNLIVLARAKRPHLMLVTVPVLSLLASVAVLVTGFLSAGLDVRASSHSLTLLDQRSHRAVVVEDRVYFAGMTPGSGLTPAAGTAVLPVLREENAWGGEPETYRIEQGAEGRLLRGDFLRVRDMVRQMVFSSSAARGRLRVELDGGGLVVTNELPSVAVRRLLVCDAEGAYWVHDEGLQAGATRSLQRLGADASAAQLSKPFGDRRFGEQLELRPGTYLAELEDNPWRDATGLEGELRDQSHVLFGVLDEEEGR